MVIVGIKNGVIDICVSVDDLETLAEMYPDLQLLQQTGPETLGWAYDGTTFTAPQG